MSLEGRTIGLIEDDPIMGESLVQSLGLAGSHVHWWRSGREARAHVLTCAPDLVVCDIRLPDGDGGTLYRELGAKGPLPPFLFMTAYGSIDEAVGLIRAGGGDYVTKPFGMQEFLDRASALLVTPPSAAEHALGVSEAMRQVESTLRRVAIRPTPVLILGETGVGKEVCARYLHRHAVAAGRPFMAVNCAAIPSELMESELFGHEKGAFSGAVSLHRGYAERTEDGTLFLDEIADLPMPMQAKLLRLIEARAFTRVGGEKPVAFRGRVVCATNAKLEAAIADGRFREDLFYRINVISITVPPLAGRDDDIRWLARRFLAELADGASGRPIALDAGAERALLEHSWQGNVRELRNRIERAVLMARSSTLHAGDLFPERAGAHTSAPKDESLRAIRDNAERRQIERVIAETGGHLGEAARILQVSRTTLWEKIKRYGIVVQDDI
jgi:DNA-binding NtrC family response regulator